MSHPLILPAFDDILPAGVKYGFFDHTDASVIAAELAQDEQSVHRVRQVHSADFITLNAGQTSEAIVDTDADAMISITRGQVLGIVTADCVPLLLCGTTAHGPIIAAVHAGWRGTVQGIVPRTIAAMFDLGANNIAACIGPCIRPQSYEVDDDVREAFLAANDAFTHTFRPNDLGRWQFDLPLAIWMQCAAAGVWQVYDCGVDTYPPENGFHSYRRATHLGQADYLRQMAAIVIT